jgi:DNA-binding HxlR family transcriptional regulator
MPVVWEQPRGGQHGGVPTRPLPSPMDPSEQTAPPGHTPRPEPAPPSALDNALAQVGDRWSLLVVDALLEGPRRFGELQERIAGIATNVLTQRLRHLANARIVVARPYSQRPLRSAYELTASGRELAGALRLLAQWGADHEGHATTTHAVCGTPLQARWWCPTCDLPVDNPNDGPTVWA